MDKTPAEETEKYIPKVGDTLFVSLYGFRPFLTTITELNSKNSHGWVMFSGTRNDKVDKFILKEATFYPDVPTDTKFMFLVVGLNDDYHTMSEDWFFDIEEAVKFSESKTDDLDYQVTVERTNRKD